MNVVEEPRKDKLKPILPKSHLIAFNPPPKFRLKTRNMLQQVGSRASMSHGQVKNKSIQAKYIMN
jgi:hypothetical protein